MDTVNSGIINLLDKIRYGDGGDKLIDYFSKLVKKDLSMSVDLINQESLSFTSLYLLQPKIKDLGIFEGLSIKNKIAIDFMDETIMNKKSSDSLYLSSKYISKVYSALKWILETGAADDGLDDKFDEILDKSAAILTIEYRDRSILSVISDMIFKRYKKGFFIHDLVWAFFESRDTHSLVLIANRLQSEEPKDVELACSLLCFVPGIEDNTYKKSDEKYLAFINWIEENNMFLRFTGESFQLTRSPSVYIINLDAKYLCKMVSVDTGETLRALNEKECELLDEFKALDEDNKKLLSGFSLAMHRKNMKVWDEWMGNPINEQLRIARSGGLHND
jgi:hypothetical protein